MGQLESCLQIYQYTLLNTVKMKGIINIHVGQAGIQMGQALWRSYNQQFGLNDNGQQMLTINKKYELDNQQTELDKSLLYNQLPSGQYRPRALFYDSDPMSIDKICKQYKMIPKNQTVKGNQHDSIYSCGMYKSEDLLQQFMEKIRKQAQKCDLIEGFMVHHSVMGGTGSGATAFFNKKLNSQYNKTSQFNFSIYPSQNFSNNIVEPYNTALGISSQIQDCSMVFPIQNEQLYRIYTDKLDIDNPYLSDINKTISHLCTNITLPMCITKQASRLNFKDYEINLIPYKNFKFICSSMSPFLSNDAYYSNKISLSQSVKQVHQKDNFLLSLIPQHGRYISNYLLFRGDVSISQAIMNAKQAQNNYQQVDWVQSGMKVSILNRGRKVPIPHYNDTQVTGLCCTYAIAELFSRINHKFDLLYSKRAYVHWYVSYSEQLELCQARQNLAILEKDLEDWEVYVEQQEYEQEYEQQQ